MLHHLKAINTGLKWHSFENHNFLHVTQPWLPPIGEGRGGGGGDGGRWGGEGR